MQAAKRRTLWTTVVAVALLVMAASWPAAAKTPPAAGAAGSGSPLLADVDVGLNAGQHLDIGAPVDVGADLDLAIEAPRSWTYLADLARFSEDAKWRLKVDVQGLAGGCLEPSARLKTRVRGYQLSGGGSGAVTVALSVDVSRLCVLPSWGDQLTGLFVTADPLGYVDGPSMYAFAGFDPVNKADPLGLYQVDFHYYVVYLMAALALGDEERAHSIAYASQFADESSRTKPVKVHEGFGVDKEGAEERLRSFHFVAGKGEPTKRASDQSTRANWLLRRVVLNAHESEDDVQFGLMLHSYADSFSHEGFVGHVNKAVNERSREDYDHPVIQMLPPLGHMDAGHDVDEPFRDPEKAAEAAIAIYRELVKFGERTGGEDRGLDEARLKKQLKEYFSNFKGDKKSRSYSWRVVTARLGVTAREFSAKAHPSEGFEDAFEAAADTQEQWVLGRASEGKD